MRHCILLLRLHEALYLTALLVVGQVAACGRAMISLHCLLVLIVAAVSDEFALPLGPDCSVCKR